MRSPVGLGPHFIPFQPAGNVRWFTESSRTTGSWSEQNENMCGLVQQWKWRIKPLLSPLITTCTDQMTHNHTLAISTVIRFYPFNGAASQPLVAQNV